MRRLTLGSVALACLSNAFANHQIAAVRGIAPASAAQNVRLLMQKPFVIELNNILCSASETVPKLLRLVPQFFCLQVVPFSRLMVCCY